MTVPLCSLSLLKMSLFIACADPGCLKKGVTSNRQSPMNLSAVLNSKANREGSSGTSIRKTSLMVLPEGEGVVLHLAMSPSDKWHVISVYAVGMVML